MPDRSDLTKAAASTARAKPLRARRSVPPLSVTLPAVLAGGNDRAFRRVIHGLLVTAARLTTIRAGFGRDIGLSGAQYTILMAVARLQGNAGVGIRAVAEHLHVVTSHITTEAGKLVAAGLLVKDADADDGRAVRIALTTKGAVTIQSIAPLVRHINNVLFDAITRAEFESLDRFLEKFLVNTERAARRLAERPTSDSSVGKGQ